MSLVVNFITRWHILKWCYLYGAMALSIMVGQWHNKNFPTVIINIKCHVTCGQLHHKMSHVKMILSLRHHDNQDNDRQYNDTLQSLSSLNIMSRVFYFIIKWLIKMMPSVRCHDTRIMTGSIAKYFLLLLFLLNLMLLVVYII